jgi:hypothetical protein
METASALGHGEAKCEVIEALSQLTIQIMPSILILR